jgi:hypothetical protein
MRKTTYQRVTTKRIQEAAPELKYVALYHRDEERLNACMMNYEGRSFVYVLTSMYEGKEYYLYVGKSKAAYSRQLTHAKKYEYDFIYLYECEPERLTDCERATIMALAPLFNRSCNPKLEQIKLLLDIDYDATYDAQTIQAYLKKLSDYETLGLFGFALPAYVFLALEKEASKQDCTCSEWMLKLLEKQLGKKIMVELDQGAMLETNLVSAQEYGNQYERSVEQAKVYCKNKRVAGCAKIGRDWLIPSDAKLPEDRRGKRKSPEKRKVDAEKCESVML